VHAEVRMAAAHHQPVARLERTQRSAHQEVGAAVEPELLSIDSRRR
jgi:hypothetical protein